MVGPAVGCLVQVVTVDIDIDVVDVVVVIVDATADIVFAVMEHGSFDDWSETKHNRGIELSVHSGLSERERRDCVPPYPRLPSSLDK